MKIPDDLRELYEAAKGVQGTGLPIPWAADRAIELIERLAKCQMDRDMVWLNAFVDIDTHIAYAGDPAWYVKAVFEPCLRRANNEAALNVDLRIRIGKLAEALDSVLTANDFRGFLDPRYATKLRNAYNAGVNQPDKITAQPHHKEREEQGE